MEADLDLRATGCVATARPSPKGAGPPSMIDTDRIRDAGVEQNRARHKIRDAYRNFATGQDGFAAVVSLVDRTVPDHTIGEALYGRARFTASSRGKKVIGSRAPDALFGRGHSRLTAAVVARRTEVPRGRARVGE